MKPDDALPIIVVGSANQDYIVRVKTPPAPGETILADDLLRQPGGKGANQAVAAARLNGVVSFVGSVGDDPDGAELLRGLRSEGVDTSEIEIIDRGRTGLAFVSVFENGENSITVVPGTNFALDAGRVTRTVLRLAAATHADGATAVVVVQAELRTEIIRAALSAGETAEARCVMNLAPYQPLDDDLLALCDPLVVNESEASNLVGFPVTDAASARRAAETLTGQVRSVVMTLGAAGAYWADGNDGGHVVATEVEHVVDTTGAGDAFVGALAAALARGTGLHEATQIGVAAGTFAVSKPGAQSSYPTRTDLDGLLGAGEPLAQRSS